MEAVFSGIVASASITITVAISFVQTFFPWIFFAAAIIFVVRLVKQF